MVHSEFQKDPFADWMVVWAKENRIPLLNLYDRVVEWYTDPGRPRLYQITYFHFNETGLAWAAGWIKTELMKILNP